MHGLGPLLFTALNSITLGLTNKEFDYNEHLVTKSKFLFIEIINEYRSDTVNPNTANPKTRIIQYLDFATKFFDTVSKKHDQFENG